MCQTTGPTNVRLRAGNLDVPLLPLLFYAPELLVVRHEVERGVGGWAVRGAAGEEHEQPDEHRE
jgi:hypothetical protein